jgi:UDP-GlcNAc:undecaprenyl-phosphate GlcNAc-1-phosphate transferase
MIYCIVFIILFLLELAYFKVADRYNIIDKPNERSSHTQITLRGGGIIFYIAALLYFIYSGFQYPWFILGLTLMTVVSFADDVLTLSNKVRLFVHFISVLLMAYELQIFTFPWYYLVIAFIIIVGVINAYNFMDGINGITASYSFAVGTLLLVENYRLNFIDQDLLIFSILGILVFTFFNFRTKAKCFAGDVGSVAIAFILLFAMGKLILQTGNFIYFLFLAIYGVDSIWTIVRRLYLKENIFEAHRSHLYQYLGNEAGKNKLVVSFMYGLVQFVIGLAVLFMINYPFKYQVMFAITLLLGASGIYLIYKTYIIKKYVE